MTDIEKLVTALAYQWWVCGVPDEYQAEWEKESEITKQSCIRFAQRVHQLYSMGDYKENNGTPGL